MFLFSPLIMKTLFICEQFLLFLKRPLSLFLSWMAVTSSAHLVLLIRSNWICSVGTQDKGRLTRGLVNPHRPNHFWLLICKMRFLNLPHYLLSIPHTWGTLIKETAFKELKNKTSTCSWGHSANSHWGSAIPGALHIKKHQPHKGSDA